jgi:S1-C subfamily serine protease
MPPLIPAIPAVHCWIRPADRHYDGNCVASGSNAGIGFAIPVDTVNRVVPEIIRTGRASTRGIGIVVANDALAARLGVDGIIIIIRTVQGSPADRAGLQVIDTNAGKIGDVIVDVDGKQVRKLSDLTDALQQRLPWESQALSNVMGQTAKRASKSQV